MELKIGMRRVQDVAGLIRGLNNDRNPNRFAQVDGMLAYLFDLAYKTLNEHTVPAIPDYRKFV